MLCTAVKFSEVQRGKCKDVGQGVAGVSEMWQRMCEENRLNVSIEKSVCVIIN